jgi:Ca2+-binding EF-hand superfamily protein
VGYGDTKGIHMVNNEQWWFSIVFVSFGVVSFTLCLGNIVSIVAELLVHYRMDTLVKRGVTMEMIEEMDVDGSGEIERIEFLQTMLVEWGRCTREDIEFINEVFDALDRDAGGTLNADDIRSMAPSRR